MKVTMPELSRLNSLASGRQPRTGEFTVPSIFSSLLDGIEPATQPLECTMCGKTTETWHLGKNAPVCDVCCQPNKIIEEKGIKIN